MANVTGTEDETLNVAKIARSSSVDTIAEELACATFKSDNTAGCYSQVIDALIRANQTTHQSPYGLDDSTKEMLVELRRLFEHDTLEAYCVPTGTAANCLALSVLTPAWGSVICTQDAHIVNDECGAPEAFTGGMVMRPLEDLTKDGKLYADQLHEVLECDCPNVHRVVPSVVSITNSTECGTVYSVEEVTEIGLVAKKFGLNFHMDGARIANALAYLQCTPAELTWKAGLDILSFGLSKAGAMCAEVVVVFNLSKIPGMEKMRKRAAQLFSKHRFVSCQVVAMLKDNLFLNGAVHANQMCQRIAGAIREKMHREPVYKVQANELFIILPEAVVESLEKKGIIFYVWKYSMENGVRVALVRFVTSFATSDDEVSYLISLL